MSSKPELDILTSPEGQRMLTYVTDGFYDRSYVGLWLYEVMGRELDWARQAADDLKLEAFPQTATWSIPYWEDAYGFERDESLPLEYRRQRILARITEHTPMNPEHIRRIAELLSGARAEVVDPVAPYRFAVILYDVDQNTDHASAIRRILEIKPSHLGLEFATNTPENENILNADGASGSTLITILPGLTDTMEYVFIAPLSLNGIGLNVSVTTLPRLPDVIEGGETCTGLLSPLPAEFFSRSSLLPRRWPLAGLWSDPDFYPKD
jgi:hypothetical protein